MTERKTHQNVKYKGITEFIIFKRLNSSQTVTLSPHLIHEQRGTYVLISFGKQCRPVSAILMFKMWNPFGLKQPSSRLRWTLRPSWCFQSTGSHRIRRLVSVWMAGNDGVLWSYAFLWKVSLALHFHSRFTTPIFDGSNCSFLRRIPWS